MPFQPACLAALPPGHDEETGLTMAKWADYLNFLAQEEENREATD